MLILRKIAGLRAFVKVPEVIRLTNVGLTKSYSVYAPDYKQPVFTKKEQVSLEKSEVEILAHSRIRPALGHHTSSEFYDPLVQKFTAYLMRKGRKQLARSLLEHAFEKVKRTQLQRYHRATSDQRDQIILDPVEILYKAVENTKPVMELLSMKRGGGTYQVPVPVLENRQKFLAMNWMIQAAKEKDGEVRFHDTLAKELIDAAHNHGRIVKKKQDLHKQCEANRAYAHYRWS